MKSKIKYTDEPMGDLRVVPDFLPPREELVLKKEKRSAIYGKLSIVCSVIPISLLYFMVVAAISAFYHPTVLSKTIAIILNVAVLFSIPVGCLLGYLSLLKQETPKCYRYIGFFLNSLWLIPFIHVRLGGSL